MTSFLKRFLDAHSQKWIHNQWPHEVLFGSTHLSCLSWVGTFKNLCSHFRFHICKTHSPSLLCQMLSLWLYMTYICFTVQGWLLSFPISWWGSGAPWILCRGPGLESFLCPFMALRDLTFTAPEILNLYYGTIELNIIPNTYWKWINISEYYYSLFWIPQSPQSFLIVSVFIFGIYLCGAGDQTQRFCILLSLEPFSPRSIVLIGVCMCIHIVCVYMCMYILISMIKNWCISARGIKNYKGYLQK